MVDLADPAPLLVRHIRQIHAPDIVAVAIPGEGQVAVLYQKGIPGIPDGPQKGRRWGSPHRAVKIVVVYSEERPQAPGSFTPMSASSFSMS